MDTITGFFLGPPLAIARVGSGTTPLESYAWGPNDDGPRGTGKTTIRPATTLVMGEDGTLSAYLPKDIRFKEMNHRGDMVFRPVCPWFQLWCTTSGPDGDGRRPVVPDDLADGGAGVTWDVELGNRKAYNMTLSRGDIVRSARVAVRAGERKPVPGWSQDAADGEPPLVLAEAPIPLGRIAAARPHPAYGLRARFLPPEGHVYGPSDLPERLERDLARPGLPSQAEPWLELDLIRDDNRERFCILNPQARWCTAVLPRDRGEWRTSPVQQFGYIRSVAQDGALDHASIGLLDDFSDGVVRCSFTHDGAEVVVSARLLVGPPDFAPDRRHVVTLADLLRDREYQADRELLDRTYDSVPLAAVTEEIRDLFQRAYETVGLTNLDHVDNYITSRFASPQNPAPAFGEGGDNLAAGDLALTRRVRELHRRLIAQEVLEDGFRERAKRAPLVEGTDRYRYPRAFSDLVNAPPDETSGAPRAENTFRSMPALMRGSTVDPMHLTRWQYDLLMLWIDRLQGAAEGGSDAPVG